jgi:hypothetical protein
MIWAASAIAQDASPASAEMIKDYAGLWLVQDGDGAKSCPVTLGTDQTIGGYAVDVGKECPKLFPVMDEIAAWTMLEDGTIIFADATRHARLRFYTPDDSYVSVEEVDGIVRLTPASE